MKRLLVCLAISWVAVGCSGVAASEVTEGDEQSIVSGTEIPDPASRGPASGGGMPTAAEQAAELRGRLLANEPRQGPTDPMPWHRKVDEPAQK